MRAQVKKSAVYSKSKSRHLPTTVQEKIDAQLEEIFAQLSFSPREALPKIHHVQTLACQYAYAKAQARALLAEGMVEVKLSNYTCAADRLGAAISLLNKLDDREGLAKAYQALGAASIKTGQYPTARENLYLLRHSMNN